MLLVWTDIKDESSRKSKLFPTFSEIADWDEILLLKVVTKSKSILIK